MSNCILTYIIKILWNKLSIKLTINIITLTFFIILYLQCESKK